MNYPYANGTIKATESKILDKNKLLVLTKYDKSEFVKVLLAMNYGKKGNSLEELINSEAIRTKVLIDSITPNKEETNLFYLVNDALNIKIIYKMKIFNLPNFDINDNLGTINFDSLYQAINNNDYCNLSNLEKQLIKRINECIKDVKSPKVLSAVIDNEIYDFAYKKAKTQILKKYLTLRIDVTNIISMVRAKRLKWNYQDLETMLIDNGKISKNKIKEIYLLEKAEQIKCLEPYYNEQLSKALKNIDSLSNIEVIFEKFILDEMAIYKDEPFTIGPMIYYYLLKKAESQNIRLLYNKETNIKNLI